MPAIKDDPIAFLNSPTHLILGRKVADRYGLKLHDKVPLATPDGVQQFEVWGLLGEKGVGRAFGGDMAIMYYQAAQVAFARGTQVDRIDVAVKPGQDAEAVAKRLEERLGAGFTADRPERRTDQVNQLMSGLDAGLMMSSLVALLVGIFLIYNTISIGVVQRKRELGILRALGTTRRQTLALFVLEGLLFGVVGSTLGAGLGVGLAKVLLNAVAQTVSEIYVQVAVTNVSVDPKLLAGGFVLGVIGAVVAALVPAREAMRVSPVETLRTSGQAGGGRPPRGLTRADVGAIVFGLATAGALQLPPWHGSPIGGWAGSLTATLAGAMLCPRLIRLLMRPLAPATARLLGVQGRIAAGNLPRDLARNSVTIGALMIAVAMTVSIGTFMSSFQRSAMNWIDQTLPADLFITASSSMANARNVPISAELREPMAKLPGVEALEAVRILDSSFRGWPIKIVASQLQTTLSRANVQFLEGDTAAAKEGVAAGAVIVSENFSRRFQLHRGDRIALDTPTGPHEFPIVAVIIDYTSDQGTVVLDRSVYDPIWSDSLVDTYKLYLAKGADIEATRRAIADQYGEKYDLFVLTNAEVKNEIVTLLEQTFLVMHALELVAIIIAVLGVVNASLAGVLDRTREIGVLRAIGMLRAQVRKMVMTEAGLVGLTSSIIGFGVGLFLGYILLDYVNLTQTGWYIPFRPPWFAMARTLGLVVVAAVAAGWYPARQAAGLPVTRALEYE
jgi:putative ABC transport system permease protein